MTAGGQTTNRFQYNGLGLRVRKTDSSGTRLYVCDGAEPGSGALSDGSAVYTPGISERRGGVSKEYHGDAPGSTRGITNASQSATDAILYDAFGLVVSRTGTTPTPFGYAGAAQYQSDPDSGLLLLGHRYYDPSIGRFVTQDPIRDGDNWYAYVQNNPLTRIDPQGLEGDTGLLPPDPITGKPRLPWGYDSSWREGTDKRGPYVEDPDTGMRWYPHGEDDRHWPHYDYGMPKENGDPPDQKGMRRYPGKSVKPRPNQRRGINKDQSWTDPWLNRYVPVPFPSDPHRDRAWWNNVDWRDVGIKTGIVVGGGFVALNPELWPAIPIIAPKLIPRLVPGL